jgi:hypothetical protein
MGTRVPVAVFDFHVEHGVAMIYCVGGEVEIICDGGCLFLDWAPFLGEGPTF